MAIEGSNIVYSIGVFLNVLVLCFCCKKWKTIGNIKFLVTIQAVLSSLAVSVNLAFLTESVDLIPKGKFLCYELPSLVIFFLCLAVLNLTCLACVKYAQITDTCHLRRSSYLLMFLAVFCVSTVMSSPIFYSIDKGWPIINLKECCTLANASNISDAAEVPKKVHFNIVRYAFWFLVLQFIVPVFVIVSRLVLILIHLWQDSVSTTVTSSKPHNQDTIRFTVNVIFTVLFVLVVVFLSLSVDDIDSDEALAFLNVIFHKFCLSFVVVLCCPWYLVEMIRSQCANNHVENYCLREYTKQRSELNI